MWPDASLMTSETLWRAGREEAATQGQGDVLEGPLGLAPWVEFREELRGTGPLRIEVGVGW